jgi:hypothetical protein
MEEQNQNDAEEQRELELWRRRRQQEQLARDSRIQLPWQQKHDYDEYFDDRYNVTRQHQQGDYPKRTHCLDHGGAMWNSIRSEWTHLLRRLCPGKYEDSDNDTTMIEKENQQQRHQQQTQRCFFLSCPIVSLFDNNDNIKSTALFVDVNNSDSTDQTD